MKSRFWALNFKVNLRKICAHFGVNLQKIYKFGRNLSKFKLKRALNSSTNLNERDKEATLSDKGANCSPNSSDKNEKEFQIRESIFTEFKAKLSVKCV